MIQQLHAWCYWLFAGDISGTGVSSTWKFSQRPRQHDRRPARRARQTRRSSSSYSQPQWRQTKLTDHPQIVSHYSAKKLTDFNYFWSAESWVNYARIYIYIYIYLFIYFSLICTQGMFTVKSGMKREKRNKQLNKMHGKPTITKHAVSKFTSFFPSQLAMFPTTPAPLTRACLNLCAL